MADIRINQLPIESTPTSVEYVAIDGASTRKATIQTVVDAGAPIASQAKAEAGTDNNDRMTALTTKQAIDFISVPLSRTITAGTGLTGGGSLAANISLSLSSTSLSSLALADTSVQPTRQVLAGTGLSGGGALSSNVTLNLSSATQTSLGLANTAIQDGSNALVPNGGTLGQVLVKNSGTNRDTGWATVAAATAVSYSAQTLTASQQTQARSNIGASLKGNLFGLTISNNSTDATNDMDISAGEAASDDSTPILMSLSSTLTKRIDASWAVGTGNGGLDTGAVGNNTYHIFLIRRSDTGVVDALFSLSPTSPTMPSGYDAKRRIGSFYRTGGANIQFSQIGDYFYRSTVVQERNNVAAISNTLLTLAVPTGIKIRPMINGIMISTGVGSFGFMQVANGDMATTLVEIVRTNSGADVTSGVVTDFYTNTSAQIRFSQGFVGSNVSSAALSSIGWIDERGKS